MVILLHTSVILQNMKRMVNATYAATSTPKTNARTVKSKRSRIVMYVGRSLGSRPTMARRKLQILGLCWAAANVGGVGGSSRTRKMRGETTLDMMPRTRIYAKNLHVSEAGAHMWTFDATMIHTDCPGFPTRGDMS